MQYLYADLFVVLPFVTFLPSMEALPSLTRGKPECNLVSFSVVSRNVLVIDGGGDEGDDDDDDDDDDGSDKDKLNARWKESGWIETKDLDPQPDAIGVRPCHTSGGIPSIPAVGAGKGVMV